MKRIPWLAALLNIIPLPVGLGYLYLGRPGHFARAFLGTIAASVLGLVLTAILAFTALFIGGVNDDRAYIAIYVFASTPLLLRAWFTAKNAYILAGLPAGPQRPFWLQAGKSALALFLIGIPATLGVLLLDPAQVWRKQPHVNALALSPAFASDRTLFASTAEGVFRSTDAGANWQRADQGLPLSPFGYNLTFSPTFATDRTLFAGTFGYISRSTDAGESWQWAGRGLPLRGCVEIA